MYMNQSLNLPEKGFYIHYKHDPTVDFNNYMYEVIGIGRNTEDKTFTVLYRPVYENNWFAPADLQSRPLDIFNESVEVDGKIISRFRKIEDVSLIKKLTKMRDKMYEGK